mmetsp:Transcript_3307/g.11983  ORF Transcript_3307/g.11983 Transcript_3307/m.11983 type:complete len:556 (+) Transcript_3307:122-1789(+)
MKCSSSLAGPGLRIGRGMLAGFVALLLLQGIGSEKGLAAAKPHIFRRCGLDTPPKGKWEFDEWLVHAYITAVQSNCTTRRPIGHNNAGIGSELYHYINSLGQAVTIGETLDSDHGWHSPYVNRNRCSDDSFECYFEPLNSCPTILARRFDAYNRGKAGALDSDDEPPPCNVIELMQRLNHLKCPSGLRADAKDLPGSLLREFDEYVALSRKSLKEEQRLKALLLERARLQQSESGSTRQLLRTMDGVLTDVESHQNGTAQYMTRKLLRRKQGEPRVNKEWEERALAELEHIRKQQESDGKFSAPNLARLYNGGLLAFATKLSAKLNFCRKSHGLYWFAAQLAKYALRPKPDVLNYVEMLKDEMGLPRNKKYIGCHIRHGDKDCKMCRRHSWDEYAHVLAQVSVNTGLTSVFLASDDEDAFVKLPALLPHLTFYHIPLKFFPLETFATEEMWKRKDYHACDVVQAVYKKFRKETINLDEGRTLIAQLLILAESALLVAKLESTYGRLMYVMMYQWLARNDDFDAIPPFWDMNGMGWFWASERDLARFWDEPVADLL